MPVLLSETDVGTQVADCKSVLIVPCRFCPAASLAVNKNEPYIELFRRFLKTASYEKFVQAMKQSFEDRGIKTSIFRSRLLHQFVLCMWTSKRRAKLRERAKKHEAVVVVGCEAAVRTISSSLETTSCRVVRGMRSEGIMSIQPTLQLPCNVLLELESVTPNLRPE